MLWLVWPLDEQMRDWLDERGTRYPDKASRFPTGDEIKNALGRLNGYTVTLNDNGLNATWQAIIESTYDPAGAWTLLQIDMYTGDDRPQQFHFDNGSEDLIKEVLAIFVPDCGPLVLISDAGDGEPQVIEP